MSAIETDRLTRPRRPGVVRSAGMAVVVAGLSGRVALAQCAMCGSAVATSKVGEGIYYSILFLLGTLFTLVGGLVLIAVRSGRGRAIEPAVEPSPQPHRAAAPPLGAPSGLGASPRY